MANVDYVFIQPSEKKPIFLLDKTRFVNGKPIEISYSQDMVDKGVSLKVEKTSFVLGRAATEKDIIIMDKDDVKYSSDDYFKDRNKQIEVEEETNVERKAEAVVESFQAFNTAVEKSVGLKGTGKTRSKKVPTSI